MLVQTLLSPFKTSPANLRNAADPINRHQQRALDSELAALPFAQAELARELLHEARNPSNSSRWKEKSIDPPGRIGEMLVLTDSQHELRVGAYVGRGGGGTRMW